MDGKNKILLSNKDDIEEGIKLFVENKRKSNKELEALGEGQSEEVKEIVSKLKIIVDGLLIKTDRNLTPKSFKHILLKELLKSDDLYYFGLGKKIEEIYFEELHNCGGCEKAKNEEGLIEYNELLEKSPLVIFNWSPIEGYQVKKVTKNVEKLTGYSDREFLNNSIVFADIIHPEDLDLVNFEVEEYTQRYKAVEFEQEYRIVQKNGEIKDIYDKTLVKYDKEGNVENLFGFIYDITQKRKMEGAVKRHAYQLNYILNHDEPSGLPNLFKCEDDISKSKIKHLVVFKIKEFRKINSLFGRKEGDEILLKLINEYAKIEKIFGILNCNLYRFSTTEFGLSLNPSNLVHIKPEEITLELNKVLDSIKLEHNGVPLYFSYSMGGSFNGDKKNTLNESQIALDESKRIDKGDKITIYTELLENKLSEEYNSFYSWIRKIKENIGRQLKGKPGNFKVYYQGIKDNKTGKIEKHEALIRYEDEDSGKIVSPYHFLGHVHKGKMMSKMTKLVINEVISTAKNNPEDSFSINFALEDFENESLIAFLKSEISKNEINPNNITLEILEDISVDSNEIYETMRDLKKFGINLSIDDFGTGYSNFERLVKIKPNFVKIDGSLIQGILKSKEKEEIVKSIIAMSHSLGSEVIAEFVENELVQEKLIEIGVDFSQGYHFSKPSPFNE